MAKRIRQRLLDEAERGQTGRRVEEDRADREFELHLGARTASGLDEIGNVVDHRLRGQIGIGAATQDRQQSAHLIQRLPRGAGDRVELLDAALFEFRQPVAGRGGLHADDGHTVGDDVVEFLGDAVALLEFLASAQLFGTQPAFLRQLAAAADPQIADHRDDRDSCGE
ncbi:hypothetical protein GCM10009813_23850 [Brevibacterium marinum]